MVEQSPLAALDVFTGLCEGGSYECMLYIWNSSAVDVVLDKGAPLGYASGTDEVSDCLEEANGTDPEAIFRSVDSVEPLFCDPDSGLLPNWTPFFPIQGQEGFEEIRSQKPLPL